MRGRSASAASDLGRSWDDARRRRGHGIGPSAAVQRVDELQHPLIGPVAVARVGDTSRTALVDDRLRGVLGCRGLPRSTSVGGEPMLDAVEPMLDVGSELDACDYLAQPQQVGEEDEDRNDHRDQYGARNSVDRDSRGVVRGGHGRKEWARTVPQGDWPKPMIILSSRSRPPAPFGALPRSRRSGDMERRTHLQGRACYRRTRSFLRDRPGWLPRPSQSQTWCL